MVRRKETTAEQKAKARDRKREQRKRDKEAKTQQEDETPAKVKPEDESPAKVKPQLKLKSEDDVKEYNKAKQKRYRDKLKQMQIDDSKGDCNFLNSTLSYSQF